MENEGNQNEIPLCRRTYHNISITNLWVVEEVLRKMQVFRQALRQTAHSAGELSALSPCHHEVSNLDESHHTIQANSQPWNQLLSNLITCLQKPSLYFMQLSKTSLFQNVLETTRQVTK
jgi:hypothetical protein